MTTLELIHHHWPQTPRSGRSPLEIPNVTRDLLAHLFRLLEFKQGAEIGTEYGEYAETLLKANPKLKLYCVDPYLAYKGYREHTSQSKLDDIRSQAHLRLKDYTTVSIYYQSVKAAEVMPDNSLDFVYIDGNHSLPHVIADLHAWIPKVKPGGIISGHDFIRRNNRLRYQCHVVEAIHAYTQSYMIEPWFVLGSKADGEKRDTIRSFMWVKV